MKRVLLLMISCFIFSLETYCGGRYDYFYGNIYNDHINGNIDSIVETITFQRDGIPDTKFITKSTLQYRYFSKGLIIVAANEIKETIEMIDSSEEHQKPSFVNIYYNEYFNNDIVSSNKLNNNVELMSFYDDYKYNFKIRNNRIEITLENEIFFQRMTLGFNRKTKRLMSRLTENYSRKSVRGKMKKTHTENLLYEYDELGRLAYVYTNDNKEKTLKKNIYYDGILQQRIPFYKDLPMLKNDEIIICDGNKLKYRIFIRKIHENNLIGDPYFYTIIFYDEQMNQIEQFSKDFEGEEEKYIINNIMIDKYNNPIHIEYNIKFRLDLSDDFYYIVERDITYQ
jgi:hypothetical protein